jgi:hypothetical protein
MAKDSKDSKTRHCKLCKRTWKRDQPDPCLGKLPGVISACCGHGIENGYIVFANNVSVAIEASRVGRFVTDRKGQSKVLNYVDSIKTIGKMSREQIREQIEAAGGRFLSVR